MMVATALSLGGCQVPASVEDPVETPSATPSAIVPVASASDKMFTVRYASGFSFNPITGTSPDNMALVPLMYEGLFVLNEKLEAEPVLCQSYETTDGIKYTFKLKTGIAMSDGSNLYANDVKYTLTSAMQYGRFMGRLKIIDSISAPDGETLIIMLKSVNYKLPELLDIPIIKSGTIDQNSPPGSGPYYYTQTGTPRLVQFQNYRDADKTPLSTIYLRDCSDADLSVAFSAQEIDFFRDDPADASEINIRSDHEIRYYPTTILQYVGFNTKNALLANAQLRRAFGLVIDRKEIISSVYTSHATAAPLILSPNYSLYDANWENSAADPLSKVSEIFKSLEMSDEDSDGFLEIPSGGGYTPIMLTFIVNSDNDYKVRAAQMIADSLKTVGINVNLVKYDWEDYQSALETGSFDMYYADVSLPANYDLSELLAPGGSLDYGHVANSEYETRISSFLAAVGDEAERDAAMRLCAYVGAYAPVIPVLYRQLNVHTNKNVVSNMMPTQSNIFYGLSGWKVTLG